MAGSNRSQVISQLHKTLKKAYDAPAAAQRSTLEHLLFACCLENTPYETAEKAFHSLLGAFYDLNEIRVSSVQELAEALSALPDPNAAAGRVKDVLQFVFEDVYAFDLEFLKKETLGGAEKKLSAVTGATPFSVAYVTQMALDGHTVPVDDGALKALYAFGVITDREMEGRQAPGLTRAIPKPKGKEFSGLLHEVGAEFQANDHAPHLVDLVMHVNKESPWVQEIAAAEADAKKSTASKKKAVKASDGKSPAAASKTKKSAKTAKAGKTSKSAKAAKSRTAAAKTSKTKSSARRPAAKPR